MILQGYVGNGRRGLLPDGGSWGEHRLPPRSVSLRFSSAIERAQPALLRRIYGMGFNVVEVLFHVELVAGRHLLGAHDLLDDLLVVGEDLLIAAAGEALLCGGENRLAPGRAFPMQTRQRLIFGVAA